MNSPIINEGTFLCKCSYCDLILFDENPQTNTKPFKVVPEHTRRMVFIDGELGDDSKFWACPGCLTDSFLIDIPQDTSLDRLKLEITNESVGIYFDNGPELDPTHVCYWNLEEVEEDADVALAMCRAVDMYHTDKPKLLSVLGFN